MSRNTGLSTRSLKRMKNYSRIFLRRGAEKMSYCAEKSNAFYIGTVDKLL